MQKVGTKEVKRMTLGSKDGNQPGRIINKGRKKKKTKNEKKLRKHMTKNKRSDGDMKNEEKTRIVIEEEKRKETSKIIEKAEIESSKE